jgi:hypothetical protein
MSKSFGALLAISMVTSLIAPLTLVAAKPIGRNPDYPNWGNGVLWGTKLWLENDLWKGQCFFGVGPAENSEAPLFLGPAGLQPIFIEDGIVYFKLVVNPVEEPQRYSWHVMLYTYGAGNPGAGTLSCPLENDTHWFIPQDFSVVLENSAQLILVNLRKENKWFNLSSPVYATLHVDNAVNVSISPSYKEGVVGKNLTYTVTVHNTGRYPDTYSLSSTLGTISPSSLTIKAENIGSATLNVSPPLGAADITVTAVGAYASDNCSASIFGVLAPEGEGGINHLIFLAVGLVVAIIVVGVWAWSRRKRKQEI